MKKMLVAVALLSASLTMYAEALYLHVQKSDGQWELFDLSLVDKLTFKNGGMQLLGAGDAVVKEYSSAELEMMKVNEEISGVSAADAKISSRIVTVIGNVLQVNVDGQLRVFDVQGRLCADIPQVKAGNTVNMKSLPKGLYIVEIGSKTSKIVLK
ncbi:MAG: T9SS type A sorting domain-containing protein [Muribaculaceae bacterium]